MTDTKTDEPGSGPVLAEGVDDEPVESNRRVFDRRLTLTVAAMSAFYAIFHMAALNGLSISSNGPAMAICRSCRSPSRWRPGTSASSTSRAR